MASPKTHHMCTSEIACEGFTGTQQGSCSDTAHSYFLSAVLQSAFDDDDDKHLASLEYLPSGPLQKKVADV